MTAHWWVLGNASKTQFVGWSCGTLGSLETAAVYRSEINAIKKLKQLDTNDPLQAGYLVPHKITVTV